MNETDHPMMRRAFEVVHHDDSCPSIGGNGDPDCRCDAVPFLAELAATFLDFKPSDDERRAITELSVGLDLSAGAIIQQALRLYQVDYYRRKAGETCSWSGDAERAREFAGLATQPKDPS